MGGIMKRVLILLNAVLLLSPLRSDGGQKYALLLGADSFSGYGIAGMPDTHYATQSVSTISNLCRVVFKTGMFCS
jgi:hypothetical protein